MRPDTSPLTPDEVMASTPPHVEGLDSSKDDAQFSVKPEARVKERWRNAYKAAVEKIRPKSLPKSERYGSPMRHFSSVVQRLREDGVPHQRDFNATERTAEEIQRKQSTLQLVEFDDDEVKTELEELQVATIYSLVEKIPVEHKGEEGMKTLLYLTNKQARKFNFEDIDKVITTLDITPKPKLVIKLFESRDVLARCAAGYFAHIEGNPPLVADGNYGFHDRTYGSASYATKADMDCVEHDLVRFFSEIIIPLAEQTNALVLLGISFCDQSSTFTTLCSKLQAQRNGVLPFTVMSVCIAGFHVAAGDWEGSVTRQLREQSKTWKEHAESIKEAYWQSGEPRVLDQNACDVHTGCSHYVVIGGVTDGRPDKVAFTSFQNSFINRLARSLPTIGIQTFGVRYFDALADYVGRDLPLLLLDSRVRPEESKLHAGLPSQEFVNHLTCQLKLVRNHYENQVKLDCQEDRTLDGTRESARASEIKQERDDLEEMIKEIQDLINLKEKSDTSLKRTYDALNKLQGQEHAVQIPVNLYKESQEVRKYLPGTNVTTKDWETVKKFRDKMKECCGRKNVLKEFCRKEVHRLNAMLSEARTFDSLDGSMLAYLHECLYCREVHSKPMDKSQYLYECIANLESQAAAAADKIEDDWVVLKTKNKNRGRPGQQIDDLFEVFEEFVNLSVESQRAELVRRYEEFVECLESETFETVSDLNHLLVEFAERYLIHIQPVISPTGWLDVASFYKKTRILDELSDCAEVTYTEMMETKGNETWAFVLTVREPPASNSDTKATSTAYVERVREFLIEKHTRLIQHMDHPGSIPKSRKKIDCSYISFRQLMNSRSTFSGSLQEPQSLAREIQRISNMDRLPANNTLESLRLICLAWNEVDIYTAEANRCKTIAKVAYVMLLLAAMTTTYVATTHLNHPDHITKEQMSVTVVVLSLFTSVVGGLITLVRPGTKWHQLRGASLAMESEVWKYRTRTGPYTLDHGTFSREGEEHLLEYVQTLKQQTMRGADLNSTSFAARVHVHGVPPDNQRTVYTHGVPSPLAPLMRAADLNVFTAGQYKHCRTCGAYGNAVAKDENNPNALFDDHHSPLKPDEYIELRLMPQLEFYKGRLPKYGQLNFTCEVLLLLGSLAGATLAILGLAGWAAIATATTVAITAWAEFSG